MEFNITVDEKSITPIKMVIVSKGRASPAKDISLSEATRLRNALNDAIARVHKSDLGAYK